MNNTPRPNSFDYVIGIVGHPTAPDVAWSDAQLSALRDVGVNTLQMSIAWAWKPAGEVLNLEDLDDPRHVIEWRRRVSQAHKFGLRTLAHFGLPMGPQSDATTCILDPGVREHYATRLSRFFRDFPEVDDVMIYTYDQLAWLCSEFGDCPRCHGVPLHERLIPFLEALVDAVQHAKPGARLWWEPWELSAGQTYAVADAIRPDHFGLILHHTIAEVQFVNQTDLWFRNLARLAGARGIPVIGEGFFGGSGEDVSPLTHLACPRLVYQQLSALRNAVGVVGIKEYYGLAPAHFSINVAVLKAFLSDPDAPLSALLPPLAETYGTAVKDELLEAWELIAQAMEFFPWDASWALRRLFETQGPVKLQVIPNASWLTPSWQANRRGFYLVTDDTQQHPWLREDVALRAQFAARRFEQAASLLAPIASQERVGENDLALQHDNAALAAQASASFSASLFQALRNGTRE
jgi:hypothetical protein